jgi:hypothetical protein
MMAFAFSYGWIYLLLARGLIGRVMDEDPEYAGKWRRPGVLANPNNSLVILHILFAMQLPKPAYSPGLARRIWIARVMLWFWPLVLAALVFFPHLAE